MNTTNPFRYSANHGNTTPTNSGSNASWQAPVRVRPYRLLVHAPHGHGEQPRRFLAQFPGLLHGRCVVINMGVVTLDSLHDNSQLHRHQPLRSCSSQLTNRSINAPRRLRGGKTR